MDNNLPKLDSISELTNVLTIKHNIKFPSAINQLVDWRLWGVILLVFILLIISVYIIFKNVKNLNPLIQPSYLPNIKLFSIIWILLIILMGYCGYLSILTNNSLIISLFLVQLLLTVIWVPIFFGLLNMTFALVILLILAIVVGFWLILLGSYFPFGYSLILYFFWILFVIFINLEFSILNNKL